MSMKNN